jgi:probable addiction module antidote protein
MKKTSEKVEELQTFEDFERKHFTANPEEIDDYEKYLIEEFNDNPEISFNALLRALTDVMKIRGMAKIAKDIGLSREYLYRLKNPSVDSADKIINSMGYKIKLEPIARIPA